MQKRNKNLKKTDKYKKNNDEGFKRYIRDILRKKRHQIDYYYYLPSSGKILKDDIAVQKMLDKASALEIQCKEIGHKKPIHVECLWDEKYDIEKIHIYGDLEIMFKLLKEMKRDL